MSPEGYEGKCVALTGLSDRTIVASGDDPETVAEEDYERGARAPGIFFVPDCDMALVY